MSFTYVGLKSTVAKYIHRDDLTEEIVGFISLAEARIYRTLRSPEMVDFAQLTTNANGGAFLPNRYIGMRQVLYKGGSRPYALTSVGLHALPRYQGGESTDPLVYATSGSSIEIAPAGAGTVLDIIFYAAPPELEGGNVSSNGMLNNYPQLFLYGALIEAGVFMQDKALGEAYLALFDLELVRIHESNEFNRWGEAPQMSIVGA